jgi:hypothetical protein
VHYLVDFITQKTATWSSREGKIQKVPQSGMKMEKLQILHFKQSMRLDYGFFAKEYREFLVARLIGHEEHTGACPLLHHTSDKWSVNKIHENSNMQNRRQTKSRMENSDARQAKLMKCLEIDM